MCLLPVKQNYFLYQIWHPVEQKEASSLNCETAAWDTDFQYILTRLEFAIYMERMYSGNKCVGTSTGQQSIIGLKEKTCKQRVKGYLFQMREDATVCQVAV